jgi:predicted nucleic acid-binding protein
MIELARHSVCQNHDIRQCADAQGFVAQAVKDRIGGMNVDRPYDFLIAAQALRIGATLVTANVGEFARVPSPHWQDWTART